MPASIRKVAQLIYAVIAAADRDLGTLLGQIVLANWAMRFSKNAELLREQFAKLSNAGNPNSMGCHQIFTRPYDQNEP